MGTAAQAAVFGQTLALLTADLSVDQPARQALA